MQTLVCVILCSLWSQGDTCPLCLMGRRKVTVTVTVPLELVGAEVAGHRPGAQWEADTTLHNHSTESQCQSQSFPLRHKLVRIPFLEDESPTQRHYQSALISGIQYAQCSYMTPRPPRAFFLQVYALTCT